MTDIKDKLKDLGKDALKQGEQIGIDEVAKRLPENKRELFKFGVGIGKEILKGLFKRKK